jgi:hypothetical protein
MSVTRATEREITSSEGRQPPGKDACWRSCACLLDVVGALVDRDRLQQHRPLVGQQRGAALEEGVEVLPADGLDHLDRDELVELAGQVAVVLEQQRDAVLEPGGGDALARQVVLLAEIVVVVTRQP